MLTGFSLPNTQFSYAIKIKGLLKLTDDQTQKLIAKNAELEKNKKQYAIENHDADYNVNDFTRRNISKILDEKQYTTLLQLRLQKAAIQAGQGSWRDMKKFGMVTATDSVTVARDLYFYNIQRQVIQELYYGQPEVIASKMAYNDKFKPAILEQLQQKRRSEAQKSKAKNSFVW